MYPVLLYLGGATKDWGQMNSPHLRDLIPQISRDFSPSVFVIMLAIFICMSCLEGKGFRIDGVM